MFRTVDSHRVAVPELLLGGNPGVRFFRTVEATMNSPVWLAHVLTARSEDGYQYWRRMFVESFDDATEIMGSPAWVSVRLYVLLPEYLTGLDHIVMSECRTVWRCEEADDGPGCLRIQTDALTVLYSLFGTKLGGEGKATILWARSN